MRKKKTLNLTISEEARRLLTLHAERSGTSVSGLIERLIREEEARWTKTKILPGPSLGF